MGIQQILNHEGFNVFFSVMLGIGVVCILRAPCKGPACKVVKPPQEKDFDQYVYRMNGNKCYEFKTNIVECPSAGAIEAFRTEGFSKRPSPLSQ